MSVAWIFLAVAFASSLLIPSIWHQKLYNAQQNRIAAEVPVCERTACVLPDTCFSDNGSCPITVPGESLMESLGDITSGLAGVLFTVAFIRQRRAGLLIGLGMSIIVLFLSLMYVPLL